MSQGLQDQHPKVRWAACQAVGQMCTDLGPDFQEAEHARLLPGLMAVMDDFKRTRASRRTPAAAVVNFSENCEQARALPLAAGSAHLTELLYWQHMPAA